MLKIATIVGARPQFIKAAAISRVLKEEYKGKVEEILIHSGQHYDDNMSQVFFDELGIPSPTHHLNIEAGAHGKQTGQMLQKIEQVLINEKPDFAIVYGDTNTTLSGALAASKLHIPVAHIEAGLRSFNKSMPEEINRVVTDHVSTLLFSPTRTGYENLLREGFSENNKSPFTIDNPKIFHCGDVMYDNALYFADLAKKKSSVIGEYNLKENNFVLCTIHRDNNTDFPERLNAIFKSLHDISKNFDIHVIIPLHPRTSKRLKSNLTQELFEQLKKTSRIRIIDPVSYLEMIMLEKQARIIITDSGGVQKESFFYKKPCIVLRPESEWVELIEHGTTILADADNSRILRAFDHFYHHSPVSFPSLFGDGRAAGFICRILAGN
jgi:UDP-GlcNAc3NAcA epimerase